MYESGSVEGIALEPVVTEGNYFEGSPFAAFETIQINMCCIVIQRKTAKCIMEKVECMMVMLKW
jgi:hypothetical protein